MRVSSSTRALFVALAVALALAGCPTSEPPRKRGCPFDKGEAVQNEGWHHVNTEAELDYHHNPPASGNHFPVWASYTVHDDIVARGNWVHNLEHGGVVLLIGDDATDAQAQVMLDAYEQIPADEACGHNRVVVTRDALLDSHVAAVAADIVMQGDALKPQDIVDFALACRNRAPENVCQ